MRLLAAALWFTCVTFASPPAQALKLYKLTHPDGTVSYRSDAPAPGTDARIEVKDVDPEANVVPIEQFPLDGEHAPGLASPRATRPNTPAPRQAPPRPVADTASPKAVPEPGIDDAVSVPVYPEAGMSKPAPSPR